MRQSNKKFDKIRVMKGYHKKSSLGELTYPFRKALVISHDFPFRCFWIC